MLALKAAHVDVDAVRIRARHIERFHPADRAETVHGHAGAEAVIGQHILAGQQAEARRRYDQVQVAAGRADTAVAVDDLDVSRRIHLEADAPAVTAADMGDQGRAFSHVWRDS